jgi:hypothetical protein
MALFLACEPKAKAIGMAKFPISFVLFKHGLDCIGVTVGPNLCINVYFFNAILSYLALKKKNVRNLHVHITCVVYLLYVLKSESFFFFF